MTAILWAGRFDLAFLALPKKLNSFTKLKIIAVMLKRTKLFQRSEAKHLFNGSG